MATKWILFYKIFFFIISSSCASHSSASDTLKQGDKLNSSNYLVSKNGLFNLGFYKFQGTNNSFLAIWYNFSHYGEVVWLAHPSTPVWLANRNTPIANDSGILTIDQTGKLKITHNGGDPIELYSSPSTTNITAILQDSGNFIVKEANASDENMLWQSFDYPTDTLLPGMKVGINHKTGKKWFLTSMLTGSIPAPGAFTLEWDPTTRELIIRRRGVIFWTSGVLNNEKKFENIDMLDDMNNNYAFKNVTTSDEEYLMYSLVVGQFTPEYRRNISSWFLSYEGEISDTSRPSVWGGDICDGNNQANGCKRWSRPTCRSDGDKFALRVGSILAFIGTSSSSENASISLSDCKDMCWNWKDCGCTGVLNRKDDMPGCFFYDGSFTQDLTGNAGMQYYVIVQDPPPSGGKKWIIWVAIAIALIMILLGVLFYIRRRRLKQKEKFLLELMTSDRPSDAKELDDDGNNGHHLNVYTVASIMAATNCFSSENKLGEGGFGPVYKGKLANGRKIAVKRLSRISRQGLVEFKNELILIAKLQHVNLVRLLGCCIHGEEKMLVYEYMPNKSLDSFIFVNDTDQSKGGLLDWKKRFNIIKGIAQGLLYLHQYSRLRIIHRDLKLGNILLDEDMNPKISDFGMARIFTANELEANTSKVVGTYGYMSPEYAMEGIFSVKSDVFSFGVMVLEIVSGRRSRSLFQVDQPLNLVGYAWELWKKSAALELLDPKLSDSYSEDQVLRCINVGLLCVEEKAVDRPTMAEVIYMLTSEATRLPMPKQPAFSIASSVMEKNFKEEKIENCSINGLSMSVMDAR